MQNYFFYGNRIRKKRILCLSFEKKVPADNHDSVGFFVLRKLRIIFDYMFLFVVFNKDFSHEMP